MVEVVVFLFGLFFGCSIAGVIYYLEFRKLRRALDAIAATAKIPDNRGDEKDEEAGASFRKSVIEADQFSKNTLVHAWWVGGTQRKPSREEGIY